MRFFKILIGFLALALVILVFAYVSGTVYFVPEYKNAVVTRFGEIRYAVLTGFEKDYVTGGQAEKSADATSDTGISPVIEVSFEDIKDNYAPGMIYKGAGYYFKLPFFERVHFFDSRVLFWEGVSKEISTEDLRTLLINTSARWRILDPIKFYRSLGGRRQALTRLGSMINSNIEDEISETRLIETVRNDNLTLESRVKKQLKTVKEEGDVKSAEIRYGRSKMMENVERSTARELQEQFGVQLVDILLTRLNYPQSVRKNVYERMKAERNRIAARYKAQGEKKRREILGRVSKRKNELLSGAERRVKEILGEAEGKAIEIWAGAYQRDPEFFRFQRSLETYENSFDSNAVFLLSDQNRLLEFVTGSRAR